MWIKLLFKTTDIYNSLKAKSDMKLNEKDWIVYVKFVL